MKRQNAAIYITISTVLLFSFSHSRAVGVEKALKQTKATETNKQVIIAELKDQLREELDHFCPLCLDTIYGGYFTDLNYKWELDGPQDKMIVTQARLVWSNANASLYYRKKEPYYKYARHGYEFLKNVMWDKEYGGFYDLVNREGKPLEYNGEVVKTAYGNAFAIYGLSAYYKAFGDTTALNLAKETFEWLEKHSHDTRYGGYFQYMSRDGKPFTDGFHQTPPKDQNSMIHLMEAFTELYGVWPDSLLRLRLDSLFHEVRDIAIGDHPYLTLFFKRDWTPVSYRDSNNYLRTTHFEEDHISFGHNVETAWLLLETSKALGFKNDTATLRVAKWMDDFALENGWDRELGGIYDGGYIFQGENKVTIIMPTKQWWAQIEAANSFLMMSEFYPRDKMHYYMKFCEEWNYIKRYLIDWKYGGWYWGGIDKAPQNVKGPKATIWKVNYHTSRGLINCIKRLEGKM